MTAPAPEALREALARAILTTKFGDGALLLFQPPPEALASQWAAMRARVEEAREQATGLLAAEPVAGLLDDIATLEAENARLRAALDEAQTFDAEEVLKPEWGQGVFRTVLGERYTPTVYGKHRALHYSALKEAMTRARDIEPWLADVIAALIWNAGIVGNRAQFAFEELFASRKDLAAEARTTPTPETP